MALWPKSMPLPKLDVDWNKAVRSPANIITAVILAMGLVLLVMRFTLGIGGVAAVNDNNPWGIWIAFDLLCGVCLAAGGYMTSAAVYLCGMKQYHSAVRPAISTAFLGYFFVVIALTVDVGQPWRLPYPIFWSPGTTSVLFEVGLCVMIYVTVLFVEWSPAAMEWLAWPWLKKVRAVVLKLTIPLTVLGVILSTMHQSSLGALFLVSPSKLHPLWYSPFIPVFFFFSSMYAGASMVIFEGTLVHRSKTLHGKMDATHLSEANGVVLGFGKAASFIMFGYLLIRIFDVAMQNNWQYLGTGYGALFMVELFGFVAAPCFMYALGVREKNVKLIRLASVFAVAGIVLYRFNVCLVAFNWQLPSAERYFPSLTEIGFSVFIVTLIVTAYRFFATFMPVLYEHPDYKGEEH